MSLAQRIMDEYRLDAATLEVGTQEEQIQDFRNDLLDNSTSTWKSRLATVLARANGCKVYVFGTEGLSIVGRKSDADTVRYMYRWLINETDRLLKLANNSYGRTWCNNFRLGVVDALAERLKKDSEEFKAKAAADGKSTALARIASNDEAVERWFASNLRTRKRVARSGFDAGARAAGRAAGQSISLGTEGKLGAGAGRLGSGS